MTNSEIAINDSEQYMAENPGHINSLLSEEPKSEFDVLVDRMRNRELSLSYSSIKHMDSPRNFMQYFLEPRKPQTDSQKIGSLVDCLVLTPNIFSKKYAVLNDVPTTDLQIRFCEDVISEAKKLDVINDHLITQLFIDLYKKHYKTGSVEKLFNLKPYVLASVERKDVVSQSMYDKCVELSDNLLSQPEVIQELEEVSETQKKIEFELMGWKFKGFLDTYSPSVFHDLKYASDCSPDKFEYDVRKFGYDVQFGLYDYGLEILGLAYHPKFKFIVYDANFNYSIIDVDRSYIEYGRKKVEFYLNCLNKMIEENGFTKSYNFFRSRTTIYKPNWAPGFDYDVFK